MNTFSTWLTDRGRSPNTIAAYTRAIAGVSAWMVGTYSQPLQPATLTRAAALEYLRVRERAGASPATLEQTLAALRVYVQWAQANDQMTHDPLADGVTLPKQQDPGPRWLAAGDRNRLEHQMELLANSPREFERHAAIRNRAIYALLRHAGLRVAEACAVTLTDLHLSERKGEVTVVGKGNKARTVPLNAEARRAITAWLAIRPAGGDAHLFIGKRGEPLAPRGVERALDEIGQRAGVRVTPHMLRHTCAKDALEHGAVVTEVSALLGHATLNTTMRYVKPDLEDLRGAVEGMC